ncbi:MAG: acyltransferase, partial [Alphaproteobacteria bacterium]
SVLLDLLRGGSALAVLIGHAGQLGFLGRDWPLDDTFQHAGVVIFFVMSGLLVHQSAGRDGMTLTAFARARMVRVLPVAAFALIFGVGVYHFLLWYRPEATLEVDPIAADPATILAAAVFLSERAGFLEPVLNPPYWSLCYEVWFYILYGLALFTRGNLRIAAMLCAASLAGVDILLLLPTWSIGVWVGAQGSKVRIGRPRLCVAGAVAGFAMVSWSGVPHVLLFLIRRIDPDLGTLRFSNYCVTDTVAALWVAIGLIALRSTRFDPSRLRHVGRWAAGISFTLYLTHWPLLSGMATFVPPSWHLCRALLAIVGPITFARSARHRCHDGGTNAAIPERSGQCVR